MKMKAVVCTKYGPPEVLKIMDVEKPVPKDDEILIRVHATTAHVGDTRIRGLRVPGAPFTRLFLGLTKPKWPVLGMELSGVVEETGKDATRFKVGDAVIALPAFDFGAYAEYKCMKEDGMIVKKPEAMTFEEAAALSAGGMTTMICLKKANITKGQKVLIYGASGSVGSFGVQLAKYHGAEVTAVCSEGNFNLVRDLGADHVIDYRREDITKRKERYDLVFDAVEKLPKSRGKRVLKKGGIYLGVGKDSGSEKDLKLEDLDLLKDLFLKGELQPVIDRTYPFDQIVEAHRYVDKGHKKGNVVIKVMQ